MSHHPDEIPGDLLPIDPFDDSDPDEWVAIDEDWLYECNKDRNRFDDR